MLCGPIIIDIFCKIIITNEHQDLQNFWNDPYSVTGGMQFNSDPYQEKNTMPRHRDFTTIWNNPKGLIVGDQPTITWGYKQDPLISAVDNNDLIEAGKLLANGSDSNMEDNYGNRLLYLASLKENIEMIRLLLQYEAKPELELPSRSAILSAVVDRNLEIADLLLDNGANPNLISNFGTLLHVAVINNHQDMVKLLLQYGADPSLKDRNGLDSYEFAMQYEYNDIAEILYPIPDLEEVD